MNTRSVRLAVRCHASLATDFLTSPKLPSANLAFSRSRQCVGMIVGVYGLGYWIAGNDPVRHWPIILVGLLGKVLGPVGFAQALINERFPPAMGMTILTNDLIWLIPFALILRHSAARQGKPGKDDEIEETHEELLMAGPRRHKSSPVVWSTLQSGSRDSR